MQADKIISFREIDQFIDKNIPSNSYVNNYYGHKELEKFYDNEILIRKVRIFSPILALPLIGLFLSHFISKFFNGIHLIKIQLNQINSKALVLKIKKDLRKQQIL